MPGLEDLVPLIYHERQQQGSMLCAQHALNSLLQGNYFTAPDLSDIARNLDLLEESYDDANIGETSTNMDDTGFFSVQVLDNALKVWGLDLVRWRGEEMSPYQDRPHVQLAFILNYQQHWFTLRRFGPALPNVDDDPGDGHWFNLNSFLPTPEWVGKLYLGMVLQQAEADGYSVFAVVQEDPTAPLALPRTEADAIAPTLPQPSSSNRPTTEYISRQVSHTPLSDLRSPAQREMDRPSIEGFEDEDMELQAALQASLSEPAHASLVLPPPLQPPQPPLWNHHLVPLPPISAPVWALDSGSHTQSQIPTSEDLDPVTASMERSRKMLERMKAEQEMAQRELIDVEVTERWGTARGSGASSRSRHTAEVGGGDDDDEDVLLRRAIEESETMARQENQGHTEGSKEMNVDASHTVRSEVSSRAGGSDQAIERDKVYDDDDAELQAALKASLEGIPEGWVAPQLPPPTLSVASAVAPPVIRPSSQDIHDEDTESVASEEHQLSADSMERVEAVSMDELRRRRLARFGV